MLYPKFLAPGSRIGVTAPSSGIRDREAFELSLSHVKAQGYQVQLTDNVYRTEGIASTDPHTRVRQFEQLLTDPAIEMIWAATGGDMLTEMLEWMDYEKIAANPKWIMGYSDITGLLFPITLRCDMATVYGPNIGGFDMMHLHPLQRIALGIPGGVISEQCSSEMHERTRVKGGDGYHLDTPTVWESTAGDLTVRGRMLSVCADVAMFFVGTPYAPVEQFIHRYREDGIIWNFDNYALPAETLYYTLWNMKHAGWFANTRAVMISRTLFPGSAFELSYREAAQNALGDIPLVLETDTGHVKPQMTLVNGAMATLSVKGRGGSVRTELV